MHASAAPRRCSASSALRIRAAMPLPPPSDTTTAVVTGASSGIGDQFARQLSGRGDRVTVVVADLATPEGRDELGESVREGGRDVEILVNNAGFGVYQSFRSSDRRREMEQAHLLVDAVVDLTHRWWG